MGSCLIRIEFDYDLDITEAAQLMLTVSGGRMNNFLEGVIHKEEHEALQCTALTLPRQGQVGHRFRARWPP
eukprot:11183853-Lingulodinium_polyedra.AAC.1